MSLPNLERDNWQPGLYWAASSPEQQHELDVRYRAEDIVDTSHQLYIQLSDKAEHDDYEPYDREVSVEKMVTGLQAREAYENRDLSEIVHDTLTWINTSSNADRNYSEAYRLLSKAAERGSADRIDPKLLGLAVHWASIEFFSYHRGFHDNGIHTQEDAFSVIEKAGLQRDTLLELYEKPINPEAKRLIEDKEYYIDRANQTAIRTEMLRRAQILGIPTSKHGNVA